MKTCGTCRSEKPASDFYADKRRRDGLKGQCKRCHCRTSIDSRDIGRARDSNREHMRRARAKDPEKFRERDRRRAPMKNRTPHARARFAVAAAVRSGRLVPPRECGRRRRTRKLNAHHADYSRPLDVEWLCTECHGREHRRGDAASGRAIEGAR
jgi:hypothetical protein